MAPLISVIMPCYNARRTLPLALASLLAQTTAAWECIVVDDGSIDHPEEIIELIADPRIMFIRLDENRGRGAARQLALEHARGEFLCMLDADDWVYPDKLQSQLDAVLRMPEIAVLSTGMAVVDAQQRLVGVRMPDWPQSDGVSVFGPIKFGLPPIPFAPSMIAMEVAKRTGFDESMRRAEDADFLIRVLRQTPYAVLSGIFYVYCEVLSVDLANIIESIQYVDRVMAKFREHYPTAFWSNWLRSRATRLAFRIAFSLGKGEWLVRRRSIYPHKSHFEGFEAAKRDVWATGAQVFGPDFGFCK